MRKWLILPVLLAFFLVAYWADNNTMPAWLKMLYAFPNGDRVGHVFIYFGISLAFNFALPARGWGWGRWFLPLGSALAFGLTIAEEVSQFFFPARTPDWVDLACGWLGILLATLPFFRRQQSQAFNAHSKPSSKSGDF